MSIIGHAPHDLLEGGHTKRWLHALSHALFKLLISAIRHCFQADYGFDNGQAAKAAHCAPQPLLHISIGMLAATLLSHSSLQIWTDLGQMYDMPTFSSMDDCA